MVLLHWSFANGVLYLCGAAGIVLMLIGATTSNRKQIRKGFVTIIGAYLSLNLVSLIKSGEIYSIIDPIAYRFGVSPKMFILDFLIAAILLSMFLIFFPFKKGPDE